MAKQLWYYEHDDHRVGPFEERDFDKLLLAKVVTLESVVLTEPNTRITVRDLLANSEEPGLTTEELGASAHIAIAAPDSMMPPLPPPPRPPQNGLTSSPETRATDIAAAERQWLWKVARTTAGIGLALGIAILLIAYSSNRTENITRLFGRPLLLGVIAAVSALIVSLRKR